MSFKFNLGDVVKIGASDESGEVIARAEYAQSEDSYLLRYKSADGRAVESWWGASALVAA
ncbi:hypothetical protein [Paraburkholderia tropica]|uniref:hypothetical protein n=1 Tax=Paraburkholderia tropica TaxID=92647 RepID=UPI001F17E364|nr:hypothetical protein [Paraburkholderia tropica]MDE1139551.1 hypothetical protein [Paraburkholderia tropica]